MLRISQQRQGSQLTVKLEGRLLEPWLDELRRALQESDRSLLRTLDLAGLSFADTPGSAFLLQLIQEGATVVACSNFVAELLELQTH